MKKQLLIFMISAMDIVACYSSTRESSLNPHKGERNSDIVDSGSDFDSGENTDIDIDSDTDIDTDSDNNTDTDTDGETEIEFCRGCTCEESGNALGCFVPASGDTVPDDNNGMFEYYMGCREEDDLLCAKNEKPWHRVLLSPFEIQLCEVTNFEYIKFLNYYSIGENPTGCGPDKDQKCHYTGLDNDMSIYFEGSGWHAESGKELISVHSVSWDGAWSFCRWIAGGVYSGRLPTEAEWEFATRGSKHDGWPENEEYFRYPFGNTVSANQINYVQNGDPWDQDSSDPYFHDGITPRLFFDGTTRVLEEWNWPDRTLDTYDTISNASAGSGAYDMAGNLFEWVRDWYSPTYCGDAGDCGKTEYVENPEGPLSGDRRVIRGGGRGNPADDARATRRIPVESDLMRNVVGFRCIRQPRN